MADALFARGERQLAGLRTELSALDARPDSQLAAQLASGIAALQVTVRALEENTTLQRETDMALRTAARTRMRALRTGCDECRTRLAAHERVLGRGSAAPDAHPFGGASGAHETSRLLGAAPSMPLSGAGNTLPLSTAGNAPAARHNISPHARAGTERQQHTAYDAGYSASIDRAESQMSDFISMGSIALEGLRGQGRTLKGAHRRLLDAAGELGIGQQVMRLIGRRSREDMVVFFVGVALVIFAVYLLFFRWR